MKISVLSSGSSGNCFYIEKSNSAVIVDAGISFKQIQARLFSLNLDEEKIKAIFITHEHSDHIKYADSIARKLNIPVYATKKTAESCFLCSDKNLINEIKNNSSINISGFKINAFSKSHKAVEPVSYSVSDFEKKIAIITDAGYACKNVIENISDSDFLCLESNHDLDMLEYGKYPYFLKQWIKSNSGHLSNMQAALSVLEYGSKKLKSVVLSHLSKMNNTPELAFNTFSSLIKERYDLKIKLYVSEREHATPLMRV